MRISILSIGAIAFVLTISAFAETTSSTVTSRNYVDAQDALKQNKIPEAGTNYDEPGVSVVTYTEDGNGTIGERWICDSELYGDDNCDNNNLVTLDLLSEATYLPTTTVTTKTCYQYQNGDCILWRLVDTGVYGGRSCSSQEDCDWLDCSNNPNGTVRYCNSYGFCECVAGLA